MRHSQIRRVSTTYRWRTYISSGEHFQTFEQVRCCLGTVKWLSSSWSRAVRAERLKLSAHWNETETKRFQNSFKTVLFQFHFDVQTVLAICFHLWFSWFFSTAICYPYSTVPLTRAAGVNPPGWFSQNLDRRRASTVAMKCVTC